MEQKDYRLAAIMYTDISGFSRMMEKDESGTLQLLTYHNELIKGIVERHQGTVIKTIGDALLVDFKNTVSALQSALEIQDHLYVHNKEHPGLPLLVRIGLHLGDIYFYENDALGEGINIAARLQSFARPGCICFSQDVYNLVLNKIEFRAEKLGKVSLKNITKEIHAYQITTPNVEFDPERDKPRPGYPTGAYLGEEDAAPAARAAATGGAILVPDRQVSSSGTASGPSSPAWASLAPAAVPAAAPPAAAPPAAAATVPGAGAIPSGPEPDRSYDEAGSRNLLTEIRRSILQDIKTEGRRITVAEARERYGFYGVEAQEVIAAMAEQGLLARTRPAQGGSGSGIKLGVFGSVTSEQAGDFARNLGQAVEGIVGQIERSIERGLAEERGRELPEHARERLERAKKRLERRTERRELANHGRNMERDDLETGKWDKKLAEDEAWKNADEEGSRDFVAYRDSLVSKARRKRGGFIGHLASFIGVNGFLWFLNLTTSPGFPWAAIVSASWGIGLLSNFASVLRGAAKAREAESMPLLDEVQLSKYKKLNRVRDSLVQHAVSTLTVPFLLGLINFLTGPAFLWFLIPAAAMGISFLSHLIAYSATRPRLERELKESLGVTGSWKSAAKRSREAQAAEAGLGPYAGLCRDAERAKAAILAESSGAAADEGLKPSLEEYVGQVRLLAQSAAEIDRIVEAIPMTELGKDKEALLRRAEGATSEGLKAEYRKNIEEIERQEGSYEELRNQSEVIRLRLGSSVNQLKQLRIDIARLKAAGEGSPGSLEGLGSIRQRTDELTRYLEDLRKGYDESRKDPFAELEEAERRKSLEGPAAT